LKNEDNPEARHPKKPWFNSGMLLVEKREAKEDIIQDLAKHLQKIRSQQATQPAKR
jgi:signal recognition particle subunit SEC65